MITLEAYDDPRPPEYKPPLGIMPFKLWVEARITALWDAIDRRTAAGNTDIDAWRREISFLSASLEFYK